MLNLILFGPPGSGKGTQATRLESLYNLVHISTGDLFRAEIGASSELGREAKEFISRGELVPDSITIAMLRKKMKEHPQANGFIFDGFPRTQPQAVALDEMLCDLNEEINGLIMLDVPENEIVQRILLRAADSGRADDSDEAIIRNRFQVYLDQTRPVYDFYFARGKAYTISGLGSIDEITELLKAVIDDLKA